MSSKSLHALLEFLDWMGKKGVMPKNTVAGRKAATGKVLGVLEPEKLTDVTTVDVDEAMNRFFNLEGKGYTTQSLNVYRSRTNASINDFKAYLADPLSFRPNTNKIPKTSEGNGKKKTKAIHKPPVSEVEIPSVASTTYSTATNVLPIPIRPDLVVRIQGLPFDLTALEAEKIAAVVKAMAMS